MVTNVQYNPKHTSTYSVDYVLVSWLLVICAAGKKYLRHFHNRSTSTTELYNETKTEYVKHMK